MYVVRNVMPAGRIASLSPAIADALCSVGARTCVPRPFGFTFYIYERALYRETALVGRACAEQRRGTFTQRHGSGEGDRWVGRAGRGEGGSERKRYTYTAINSRHNRYTHEASAVPSGHRGSRPSVLSARVCVRAGSTSLSVPHHSRAPASISSPSSLQAAEDRASAPALASYRTDPRARAALRPIYTETSLRHRTIERFSL